jgi:hypothetical protein
MTEARKFFTTFAVVVAMSGAAWMAVEAADVAGHARWWAAEKQPATAPLAASTPADRKPDQMRPFEPRSPVAIFDTDGRRLIVLKPFGAFDLEFGW